MSYLEIEKVIGREIIDSRGNPTVEAEVWLADGTIGRGAAPSGASTGEFEALELRDGDKSRFGGKGVSKAVENINTTINEVLAGMDASDIYAVDAAMLKADGTKGNAVVSSKSARIEKDTVIAYSINANGEISVAKPAAGTGTTGAFKTANIGKSYNKVEGFYMSSTTKFVFVDTSKGLSITTVDGYKNVVDQKGVKVYVVADGVNAKYVFVQAKAASATSDAKYGFLLDTVPSVRKAADNSDLYVFSVMIDGNNKAELISSDADAFKGIAKNDRFSYTEKDGKLASVMAAPAKAEWSGKDHYVEVVGEGYLGLKGVNDTVTLADKCVVYEYDSVTNTYAESTVAVNSILNVYVNAKNEVTMIVIVGEHEAD